MKKYNKKSKKEKIDWRFSHNVSNDKGKTRDLILEAAGATKVWGAVDKDQSYGSRSLNSHVVHRKDWQVKRPVLVR